MERRRPRLARLALLLLGTALGAAERDTSAPRAEPPRAPRARPPTLGRAPAPEPAAAAAAAPPPPPAAAALAEPSVGSAAADEPFDAAGQYSRQWRLISIFGHQRSASEADELLSQGALQARLLRRWQLLTLCCLYACYAIGVGSASPPIRQACAHSLDAALRERGAALPADSLTIARRLLDEVGNQAYALGLVVSVPLLQLLGPKGGLLLSQCISLTLCALYAADAFGRFGPRVRQRLVLGAWALVRLATAVAYPSLSPFVRNWFERPTYAKVWGSMLACARLGNLAAAHLYTKSMDGCIAAAGCGGGALCAAPSACWRALARRQLPFLATTLALALTCLRESPYRVPALCAAAPRPPPPPPASAVGGLARALRSAALALGGALLRAPGAAVAAVAAAGGDEGGAEGAAPMPPPAAPPLLVEGSTLPARADGGAQPARAQPQPQPQPQAQQAQQQQGGGGGGGANGTAAAATTTGGLGALPPPPEAMAAGAGAAGGAAAQAAGSRALSLAGALRLTRGRRVARLSAGPLLRKCLRRKHFWLMAGCALAGRARARWRRAGRGAERSLLVGFLGPLVPPLVPLPPLSLPACARAGAWRATRRACSSPCTRSSTSTTSTRRRPQPGAPSTRCRRSSTRRAGRAGASPRSAAGSRALPLGPSSSRSAATATRGARRAARRAAAAGSSRRRAAAGARTRRRPTTACARPA
jgi:hypothetical protein